MYDSYVFEKNLAGDIVAIYDTTATKIVAYTYDAWGNFTTEGTQAATIGALNPFRYRGYYFDTETSLYYLQSRYYNPTWGRFLNADGYVSTGAGILGYNMFAYCNNNPIMYTDPAGSAHEVDIDKLVSNAALAAAGILMVAAMIATGGSCIPLVALWDVYKDTTNRSLLWLGNKKQTVWIETIYHLEDLIEEFPK